MLSETILEILGVLFSQTDEPHQLVDRNNLREGMTEEEEEYIYIL
jgi:hypothetical protein